MDGFEFIARLRALDDGSVCDLHLAKPIDPAELVASVATLVRRGRPQRRA